MVLRVLPALPGSTWINQKKGLFLTLLWRDAFFGHFVSFIRQKWGNQVGPITIKQVAEVLSAEAARNKPWTQDELAPFVGQ